MRAGVKKIRSPRLAARILRLLPHFNEFGHLWTLVDTPCPNLTLVFPIILSSYLFLDTLDTFVYIFRKEEEETVFMKMFLGKEVRPPRNGSEVSKI